MEREALVLVAYGRQATVAGVVEQCRRALDATRPRMLLAFCGGKHEPYAVAAALRAAFGADVPLVGGSAAGVIWRGGMGYSGLELGLAAFVDADVTPRIVTGRDLRGNEHAAAEELGAKIADVAPDGSVVLFFYDSVASTAPLRLHPGSAIVAGLEAGLAALLHEARSRLKQVLARASSLVRAACFGGVRHIRPAAIAG